MRIFIYESLLMKSPSIKTIPSVPGYLLEWLVIVVVYGIEMSENRTHRLIFVLAEERAIYPHNVLHGRKEIAPFVQGAISLSLSSFSALASSPFGRRRSCVSLWSKARPM
jgi:hypothetical protein